MKNLTENSEYMKLIENIKQIINEAKYNIAKSVNTNMVQAYWNIGRYIVEFEQGGSFKAKYGEALLTNLSKDLKLRFGRGYSRPNLNNMRKFYIYYPICQNIYDKLSWSHFCELIKLDDELERNFYEKQIEKENWNIETLKRQINSSLFLRLAASKDKQGILDLSRKGIQIQKPEDIIKDTYTLEFLNMPEKAIYEESELEEKIINNLQKFLMELGKGFTFVGRQYPILINNKHYHCDLVFYHRILKCFVLIDLKINSVQHEDVGQMNMYMGYFAKEENMPDDNPPIGIILTRNKDEKDVSKDVSD